MSIHVCSSFVHVFSGTDLAYCTLALAILQALVRDCRGECVQTLLHASSLKGGVQLSMAMTRMHRKGN